MYLGEMLPYMYVFVKMLNIKIDLLNFLNSEAVSL
jgi:hypothetical protein